MRTPMKVMEEALGRPDDWQPAAAPVDPDSKIQRVELLGTSDPVSKK